MQNVATKLFPECQRFPLVNGSGSSMAVGSLQRAGGRWGVMQETVANGGTATVHLNIEGKFTKGTGYTLAEGQRVGWDGTKIVDAGSVETPPVGTVVEAAVSGDTLAKVRLETVAPRCIKHTVTAGEDSANQVDITLGTSRAPSHIVSVQIENTSNVRRAPAGAVTALSGGDLGKVRIVDANFAVNEVVHLLVLD